MIHGNGAEKDEPLNACFPCRLDQLAGACRVDGVMCFRRGVPVVADMNPGGTMNDRVTAPQERHQWTQRVAAAEIPAEFTSDTLLTDNPPDRLSVALQGGANPAAQPTRSPVTTTCCIGSILTGNH